MSLSVQRCVFAGAIALSGCAEETVAPLDDGVVSYAAALPGSDAVAAVATSGDDVALYVCGGPTSFETRSRWYLGKRANGEADVASDDGGTAHVVFADGEVTAAVAEPSGDAFEVRLDLMPSGGPGGVYFVIDSGCRTGVVVIDHGAAADPTVQGTWCSDHDIFAQVTPITPIENDTREIQVKTIPTDVAPQRTLAVKLANPATF